jgi:hypothetical protein
MSGLVGKVKRWLVRLLVGEPAKPLPALPILVARGWTPADKDILINFMASATGICLMQRMRCVAGEMARQGAGDVMHTAHSAGRTSGFYDAMGWLESQSRIEFETISGADADQSATSAQEQQGDALLRELYSP